MLSNGAAHVAHDTFLAVCNDDTDNVYLVTSAISESPVEALSTDRRVRYHVRSTVPSENDGDDHCNGRVSQLDQYRHHSAHASPEGHFVALISTRTTKHILLQVQEARICEFCTSDTVVSVAWHPAPGTSTLLVLLDSGEMEVLDVSNVTLQVEVARRASVNAKAIVEEFLSVSLYETEDWDGKEKLNDPRGRKPVPADVVQPGLTEEQRLLQQQLLTNWGAMLRKVDEVEAGALRRIGGDDAVVPQARADDIGRVFSQRANCGLLATGKGGLPTKTDFVDMCAVPPSQGLAPSLLLLNRFGDVFAMRLNDVSLPAPLVETADGHLALTDAEQERLHRTAAEQRFTTRPSVHCLVETDLTMTGVREEALAVRLVRNHERWGTATILVLFSSGSIRGFVVENVDFLAHNARRTQADLSVTIGAPLPEMMEPARLLPTWIRSAASLVQMVTRDNVCLARYADAAYLVVLPFWSHVTKCWVYRCVGEKDMEPTHAGAERVPCGGYDPERLPVPIAVRLPYDVRGASIALGVNEVLLFPEHVHEVPRRAVLTLSITNAIVSALYAQSSGMVGHGEKSREAVPAGAGDQRSATASGPGGKHPTTVTAHGCLAESEERSLPPSREEVLGHLCTCHRSLLRGDALENVHAATHLTAAAIETLHKQLLQQRHKLALRHSVIERDMQRLRQRAQAATVKVERMTGVLHEALAHREGEHALLRANDTLGEIHDVLCDLEEKLGGPTRLVRVGTRATTEAPVVAVVPLPIDHDN